MHLVRAVALGAVLAPVLVFPAGATDVIPSGHTGTLALGANWGPYETFKGVSFRWVDNDAEVILAGGSGEVKVALSCVGGPSVGDPSAVVRVLDRDHRQVDHAVCAGRSHPVTLLLPLASGETRYVLHVDGGGRRLSGDKRILDLQVFSLDDARGGALGDIADPRNGVRLTDHWYPVERYNGETFRWMDDGGQIVVHADRASSAMLRLTAEMGPSVGARSTELSVRNGNDVVYHTNVSGHRVILVPVHLQQGDTTFSLGVTSRNLRVPHDPRTLNLRVFSVAALH